ncbi:NEDD8-activating enzyme E1 regulatory subunit [Rhodotorula toruloides ATCC 204091]|uniref:NEDD8-activating enzyme E1 regulatory subunit n=1 Tax=Rhodotorula toruloides TaxID=5286 RepID=A0A0K3CM04_RHOTO|nr:NEDD8-activating enzyme E1 regulatory subunit [Rhodotorula toruloides ATCC 204091]KAK4329797.1 NEDD8-activating enzyme E1 regulatory subunit [Rhodotorula toruloides]
MATEDALAPPMQDAVAVPDFPIKPSDRPSSKQQRYDRQLRLWASSGQSALENAHVLVVNGNATATSTLKNLVLPGVGRFTVLDSVAVDESDLGANFFIDPSSVGKPRAEEVVKFLLELNGDVQGEALVQPLSSLSDLSPYSLILAVDIASPSQILSLADAAWKQDIPLVKVETCGFYGTLRTQVRELTIVETHPESIVDLRLSHPFPALVEHANSYDYASMDTEQHGHVPAVIVLIKALEEWKASHGGQVPNGSAERKAFMDGVMKQKAQSDEENFDEAVTLYRRAGTKHGIPSDVQPLFDDPACENVSSSSSNFWILVHALRAFVRHPSNPSNLLPLPGALPDMKASSSGYVTLQTLYKGKAREDLALVKQLVGETLDRVGVERSRIADEEVETFVKHAAWLKVVRGRSLREEENDCALKGKIGSILSAASFQQPPDSSLCIYAALRSASTFLTLHNRYPGSSLPSAAPTTEVDSSVDWEADAAELAKIAVKLVEEWSEGEDLASMGIEAEQWKEDLTKVCKEVARAPPSTTLPQTSALLGGLVAQEAIKVITKQYIPLNGTCVWDGIRSGTGIVDA